MNRYESARSSGEARLRYRDGDYDVLSPGSYVTCAVTGIPIPLDELRYWNVDRQEAYADAATALRRYQELNGL